MKPWRFYVDRGGTFTDIVAEAPDGSLLAVKLLSEDEHYDDAALEGIRRCLGLPSGAEIPPAAVSELRVGTTVATNALLERRGERVALVTTRGFRDQLRIAYQNRPKLFALKIDLPLPIYERVIEVNERIATQGEVLRALDEEALRHDLARTRAAGISACAILFMHGYAYPAHERRAAEIARGCGFTQVSTSCETVPLMKYVSRGDTTVADAYLSPVLRRYAERIESEIQGHKKGSRLFFMMSSGGLAAPQAFHGKDAVLSGPAGGVVGMAETARAAGFEHVIGFDMGGTSTDVSRFDGVYERNHENEIAGVRLRVPMMAIHTIAAGGGSILHFDGARFRVGPDSAGADPGPMSYRRGGPLTVTDANVMTGKLQPEFFPRIFGENRNQTLDKARVQAAFAELAAQTGRSPEDVSNGFIRIAVENMANAITRISIARGYDVRRYALACFGGAAGQHACLVADALGITRIFIHPFSGVLSAYGMKLAAIRAFRQRAIGQVLDHALADTLTAIADDLARAATGEVDAQGGPDIETFATAHIRYEGSDTTLPTMLSGSEEMARAFADAHARHFGFGFEGKQLIVESIEVEASTRAQHTGTGTPTSESAPLASAAARHTRFYSQGKWRDCEAFFTSELVRGAALVGPTLLIEPHQTIVVEPGWRAEITGERAVTLSRVEAIKTSRTSTSEVDPVLLEVFANLFMKWVPRCRTRHPR